MDLRQFRQFIAVAEELSFRRAAERLHMAQPPLTTAIQRIEEEVGAPLIERTNRITCLTQAGEVFLEEARRTVQQAERAVQAARRAANGLNGSLRVSFVPSAARDILPPFLRRFREAYPDVELQLREQMTAQQVRSLNQDEADVGFVIPPVEADQGLTIRPLTKSEMIAALPEGHRLCGLGQVALSQLKQEAWVCIPPREGPGLHRSIREACSAAGFAPLIMQEAQQMDTIISLVAGGMGVALVTKASATAERKGVVFCPLTGKGAPVTYELALAYGRRTPVLDAFLALSELHWPQPRPDTRSPP
jgi:DNA-binding transcriptional LysR family regulator